MTVWTARSEYTCGWEFDDADCTPCQAKIQGKEATFQAAVDSAAEILYALSGRQFGLCELTLRPCRTQCVEPCDMVGPRWTPALIGGQWHNLVCKKCSSDTCSCNDICDFDLPGPVHDIVEVKVDGRVLPADSYRVDNRLSLVPLVRPIPLLGDFLFGSAFLDPSARFTIDPDPDVATTLVVGVDYGGGVYGPETVGPSAGILQLIWRGIDCVTVSYEGQDDAAIVTSRPAPNVNVPGDAWLWPAPGFAFVPGEEIASDANDDHSSVLATLLNGSAVTSNPNPPPLSRNITITDGTSMRFCPSQTDRFCWPTCQDMVADDTEENTFSVTYHRGRPLPAGGQRALAQLACELFLECIGDDCCKLPKRIVNLGGGNLVLDPMDFIQNGKTGLYGVDLWLQGVNPKQRPRTGAVLSPDMPQFRRTTWPS